MEILEAVKQFAAKAHGDQQRKFEAEPYFSHLLRVQSICGEYSNDISLLAAALLHDVLEDTPVTREEIQNFLDTVLSPRDADKTIQLVIELTDIYIKDNYPKWNRRRRKTKEAERLAKVSPEAQTIKYADIIDNSQTILRANDDFAEKYLFECKNLLQHMKDGNPELRARAKEVVDSCIQQRKKQSDIPFKNN